MVVVAILTAIAVPSYRNYVIRGNRAAAKAQMMEIANLEQQYLLANRGYADKATLEANGFAVPDEVADHYDWDVVASAGPPPTFVITFTGKAGQASDGALTLDNAGNKTPLEKWQR